MPEGINVQILKKGAVCICVFEIQKSNYSPHQTDNIYYMRLDGQNVPAPHYFVEAMFRQVKYPNIEGYLKFHGVSRVHNSIYSLTVEAFIFNQSPFQNETQVHLSLANDVGSISGNSNNINPKIVYWNNGRAVKYKDVMSVLHYGSPLSKFISIEVPLGQIPGEINVQLFFGGKNSPQKVSEYKCALTFSEELNGAIKCEIIELNENIHMHDLPQAALSKAEMLKRILGR